MEFSFAYVPPARHAFVHLIGARANSDAHEWIHEITYLLSSETIPILQNASSLKSCFTINWGENSLRLLLDSIKQLDNHGPLDLFHFYFLRGAALFEERFISSRPSGSFRRAINQ